MNFVSFKKDQQFWTIDEPKEDAEKDNNYDEFSICTDAAFFNSCFDFMPSLVDVIKHSLSMFMPLSDITKPRPNKR